MKDLIIDETLIVSSEIKNGARIIKFSADAKQCIQCLNIKNKKAFWHHKTNADNRNIRCAQCTKSNVADRRLKKIRLSISSLGKKINLPQGSIALKQLNEILNFATTLKDSNKLREVEAKLNSLVFKQKMNNEFLANIIKNGQK